MFSSWNVWKFAFSIDFISCNQMLTCAVHYEQGRTGIINVTWDFHLEGLKEPFCHTRELQGGSKRAPALPKEVGPSRKFTSVQLDQSALDYWGLIYVLMYSVWTLFNPTMHQASECHNICVYLTYFERNHLHIFIPSCYSFPSFCSAVHTETVSVSSC